MNEKLIEALKPEYFLVHSGGHHDVFCNKQYHIWAYGHKCGRVAIGNPYGVVKLRFGTCDCEAYARE